MELFICLCDFVLPNESRSPHMTGSSTGHRQHWHCRREGASLGDGVINVPTYTTWSRHLCPCIDWPHTRQTDQHIHWCQAQLVYVSVHVRRAGWGWAPLLTSKDTTEHENQIVAAPKEAPSHTPCRRQWCEHVCLCGRNKQYLLHLSSNKGPSLCSERLFL